MTNKGLIIREITLQKQKLMRVACYKHTKNIENMGKKKCGEKCQ
jgi:hypothetical protein